MLIQSLIGGGCRQGRSWQSSTNQKTQQYKLMKIRLGALLSTDYTTCVRVFFLLFHSSFQLLFISMLNGCKKTYFFEKKIKVRLIYQ